MNVLPQSLIIEIEEGQDAAAVGRSYATEEHDRVIELFDHKKQDGIVVGIFVDDIRSLRQLVRTSKKATRTIVIISDAALLRLEAQNALLKLLEEPRDQLHFLLITPNPSQLAATIRSRCQYTVAPPMALPDIPEEKKARIMFMAAGNQAKMNRLTSDRVFFEQQVALFEQAKTFLSAKKYRRITVIASVKDSREKALDLLSATIVFGNTLLRKRYSSAVRQQVALLLEADAAIRKNGNVKLWLLKTVV